MRSGKRVLVVGGSGYLGQHLLQGLSEIAGAPFKLALTYHSHLPRALLDAIPQCVGFHVDLETEQGLDTIAEAFGKPDVVVNCAAISVPRVCEVNPDASMSINIPSSLIKWIASFKSGTNNTLFIHLSTDQVYEGVKSFYKEDDETKPVNVYGKSKVAAEKFISQNCSNYAILRSSIIFGPQTLSPVPKSLFIQWINDVLSNGDDVEFFHDEFRCPVYVKDVVTIILTLTNKWISDGKPMQLVLNAGGPDRVSRAQMVEAVANIIGYNALLIKQVSASSIDRGVKCPGDTSMDISKLLQTLNISPLSFRYGVKLTLEAETRSRFTNLCQLPRKKRVFITLMSFNGNIRA